VVKEITTRLCFLHGFNRLKFCVLMTGNYEVEAVRECVKYGTAPGGCKDGPCQSFCDKYYGDKQPRGFCNGIYCLCFYSC